MKALLDDLDPWLIAVIERLLPGVGFFGNTDETALRFRVGHLVDGLEISIEASAPEILNIGEVVLLGADGNPIARERLGASIEMSSIYGDATPEDCHAQFLAGMLLHTQAESRPTLRAHFSQAQWVSEVLIRNRADIYGLRSRHLVARAFCGDWQVAEHRNLTRERVLADLDATLEGIGLGPAPECDEGLYRFIANARARIVEGIEKGDLRLSARQLLQLLPLHSAGQGPSDYHLAVCAHYVLMHWRADGTLNTSALRPLSRLLATDLSISRLERTIERIVGARRGTPVPVVISRHHIHESRLLARRDEFLDAMERVLRVLQPAGVTGMIGYGTLLGAVRDGGFLPHDDDVDLIVFDGSSTREEAEGGKARMISALNEAGVQAEETGYWHLHATVDGLVVDIFPAWREGSELVLPMEQLKLRGVPADCLLPPTMVELYGRRFPAPAKPAAFLANRYGAGWSTPDPYYEWPWPIERLVTGVPEPVRNALEKRSLGIRRHIGRTSRVAWGQKVKRGESSPPMNCLATITVAKETGYDAVEIDVRISSDGVAVLAHDDLLHGPDGGIIVSKATFAQLAAFRLGEFDGADVHVPRLEDALALASACDIDVQVDSRLDARNVARLKEAVDRSGFEATRLQFCVYDVAHAQALLQLFPESVLMWKTYRAFADVDGLFLDEARALGMDGVMLAIPRNYEDCEGFMREVRARGLRALFFIHSGDDYKLRRIIASGVDYVTTIANDLPAFHSIGPRCPG